MSRLACRFSRWLVAPVVVAGISMSGTAAWSAENSGIPEIRTSATNRVPQCATPDRLMAFVAFKPRFIPRQFKKVVLEDTAPYAALVDKIFNQIAGDALERPVNDQLGSVSTPTQIIWGRHDRLIDVSCATVLLDGIKTSELVIFEDVGHVPMIEKPAETAKHHLAFLAKH